MKGIVENWQGLRFWVSKHRATILDVLIIMMVSLISITWFRGDFMLKGGDGFFVFSPRYDLEMNLYTWNHIVSSGVPQPRSLTYIPYSSFVFFLSSLGFTIVQCEKILIYSLFALSGLSAYYLTTTLAKNEYKRIAALTSGFFYMMNPFVLTNIYGTNMMTIIFTYSIAPLILGLYIKGMYSGGNYVRYLLLILLIWLAFSIGFANPAFALPIWFMQFVFFAFFVFSALIRRKSRKELTDGLKFTLILVLLWLLLNLWWILPLAPSLNTELQSSAVSGSYKEVFMGTSEYTSMPNVIRLLGSWQLYTQLLPDPNFAWSGTYLTPAFTMLSFLVPVLVFTAPLLERKDRNVIFFLLLSIVGLFLLKGAHSPLGGINIWLMDNVPYAGSFRAHYEKLGVILALSYAFLIGITLGKTYCVLRKKLHVEIRIEVDNLTRRIRLCLGPLIPMLVILLLLFGVYAFPFWTGDVIYPGGKVVSSTRIQIPSYYYDAADWLSKDNDDFRIFVLPPASVSATTRYKWEHGYGGSDALIQELFQNRPLINIGRYGYPSANTLQYALARLFVNGTVPQSADNVLAILNVKYILLQKDFDQNFFPAPLDNLQRTVENLTGFHLEKSFDKILFYRNYAWKPIQIYSQINSTFVQSNEPVERVLLQLASEMGAEITPTLIVSSGLSPEQNRFVANISNRIVILERYNPESLSMDVPVSGTYDVYSTVSNLSRIQNPKTEPAMRSEMLRLGSLFMETGYKTIRMDDIPNSSLLINNSDIMWTSLAGHWQIESGLIQQVELSSPYEGVLVSGDSSWSNYTYEARVRLTHGFPIAGLYFYFRDIGNTYVVEIRNNGVFLGNYSNDIPSWGYEHPGDYANDRWYNLRAQIQNHTVRVSVDGNDVVNGTLYGIASGMIGLRTYDTRADFDDVRVINEDGEKLLSDDFSSNSTLAIDSIFFVLNKAEPSSVGVVNVRYERSNPTEYLIHANATEPFYLVFSESYDAEWRVYTTDDGSPISWIDALTRNSVADKNHYMANGYANVWYIDPKEYDKNGDGRFSITIQFWPQTLSYAGTSISLATFALCIAYYGRKRIKSLISRVFEMRLET